ncbi:hypothetical protein ACFL1D_00175 [Candidatus Omnitrophota bacterium]
MVEIMRHKLRIMTFLALLLFVYHLFLFPQGYCYAQEAVSGEKLIEHSKDYDAKEIIYEGEVVGEVMMRRGGAWASINDGETSMSVWMPLELAETIQYSGDYKTKGDILQVRGIFNRVCAEHGGDLDIHAITLRKIKPGWDRQERVVPAKRSLAIMLSAVLCLILILRILIKK